MCVMRGFTFKWTISWTPRRSGRPSCGDSSVCVCAYVSLLRVYGYFRNQWYRWLVTLAITAILLLAYVEKPRVAQFEGIDHKVGSHTPP